MYFARELRADELLTQQSMVLTTCIEKPIWSSKKTYSTDTCQSNKTKNNIVKRQLRNLQLIDFYGLADIPTMFRELPGQTFKIQTPVQLDDIIVVSRRGKH